MIRALMLAIVLVAAPVAAQQTQPSGTIAVEDSAQQDAAMAARIRDILTELDGYEDITVTVTSGIVTLRGEALDATQVDRLDELVSRVEGVVAIENEVAESTDLAERLNPAVARFQRRLEQTIAFMPLVIVAMTAALVVLLVGLMLARMRYPWDHLAPNAFIADLYRQIVRLVFVIAALVIALDILNATALLSTILGAAGIIGLAIGFAVRDTVENFIASIMLSIRQPFSPNDTIEIGGDTGKVIRLTSRATILLSFDGNHIRIPNSTVFKSRIVNFSRNAERRFQFAIGVDSACDVGQVRALSEATVQDLPFVLPSPAASVWIDEITDAGMILQVTGWINQNDTGLAQAKGEALRHVKAAIEAAGVEIPDTTYRIRLEQPVGTPPAPAPQPMPRPAPLPEVLEAADVQATDDLALTRIIEEEREDTALDDLLNDNAPKE